MTLRFFKTLKLIAWPSMAMGWLFLSPSYALELRLPYPVIGQIEAPSTTAGFNLPTGVWRNDGGLPVQSFEGTLRRVAWRLDAPKASHLEVIAPLRDQFEAEGYQVVLDCAARDCGGFDFRFAIDVLPEPAMHVDLNDYHYVALRRGAAAASLLVSRSATTAFVQLITLTPSGATAPALPKLQAGPLGESSFSKPAVVPEEPSAPVAALPLAAAALNGQDLQAGLDQGVPVALDDLVFASGTSALTKGDYRSLATLAAWLGEDPARKLFLVGHTDLSGALPNNIALSEKRAQAVRAALIADHGIAADRLTAKGVGPLVPRASNGAEAGRQVNRRVEAVPASY